MLHLQQYQQQFVSVTRLWTTSTTTGTIMLIIIYPILLFTFVVNGEEVIHSGGNKNHNEIDLIESNDHEAAAATTTNESNHIRRRRRRQLIPGMVQIPNYIEYGMANVYDTIKSNEIPVYWKVNRNGGSTSLIPYMNDCLNLVIASDVGANSPESTNGDILEVIESIETERKYVNVDTTTQDGLERSKRLGLIESHLADVIVTPLFQSSVEQLFSSSTTSNEENSSSSKGRYFTIFRHPVERVASVFYYMKNVEQNPIYKDMTLLDYVSSEYVESNWMVRHLSNKLTDRLLPTDVELAKLILQRKFFIAGFSYDINTVLDHLKQYFGWDAIDHYRLGTLQRATDCKQQYLSNEHIQQNSLSYPPIVEGSDEWILLLKNNWADFALYEYAQALYVDQSKFFNALQST